MKLLDIFPVILVLWFANQLVDTKITCLKNQYIVQKGNESMCLPCNDCPDGQGLSPPCGSIVKHPPPIDCVPCVAGKTYSDKYGPSSCKNCHLCSAKEIVTRNCTVFENTICSNTCEKGYYYENSTHNCQPCSYCCKDKDIRIKECQSMPSNKQCSVHSTQQCKPKPSSTVHVITTYPSNTATGTLSTSGIPKTVSIGEIVAYSITGIAVGIIIIIGLLFYVTRRKKTKRKTITRRTEVLMEDGADSQLLSDHDHACDLYIMQWNITNNSRNQITEGGRISLSLSCDNQSGDIEEENRKCIFGYEWKKDGDNIPQNNYQNYSRVLTIDGVKVADSGQYYCEIHCNKQHLNKAESAAVEIHVNPGEGKEWKQFRDLQERVKERVANLLTPKTSGIGNWMDLGREFGMKEDVLKALDNAKAAGQVLDYVHSSCPKLTVFAFCEKLKKMKRNEIVDLLKDDLIKAKENAKPGINVVGRPDSGISEECDSYSPLQVNLPPHDSPVKPVASGKPSHLVKPAFNFSYADSSREASRESSLEDLPRMLANVKQENYPKVSKTRFPLRRKKSGDSQKRFEENNDTSDEDQKPDTGKIKSGYGRQTSKDSQKSADHEDVGTCERKRSRSSSITNSIKEMVRKQPSVEYSALEQHHEDSDEGSLHT